MGTDKESVRIMPEKELLLSRARISQRVRELGRAITRDCAGGELIVVGILKGACIFTADLIREIGRPLTLDFIRAASYGTKSFTSGEIRIDKDLELDITGRDVLLVEDIVDTGRTLAALKEYLARRNPASVRTCALISKQERRQVEVIIDYIGFTVEKGFLIGYGLDYAEQYRQYPDVYHLLDI